MDPARPVRRAFAWIAPSFWTTLFGFAVILRGGDPFAITRTPRALGGRPPPARAHGIVMPVFNEDPERVMAGVAATMSSLEDRGVLAGLRPLHPQRHQRPESGSRRSWPSTRLRGLARDPARLFYRKRREQHRPQGRQHRRFLRALGRPLPLHDRARRRQRDERRHARHMVAADGARSRRRHHPDPADAGQPARRCSRAHPAVRSRRLRADVRARACNWWQAGDGNYWGHNAIIRIRAFVEHCRPAGLSGQAAARRRDPQPRLRRGGAHAPRRLEGVAAPATSTAATRRRPPTLIDYAARDRRWCQGNLQHIRLIGTPA